mmetsp:Transcript_2914/g.3310  ORF Transcript_2914/g.3310 Transcript_2914/m.3310 type:complete len:1082 (+) Transcript_2914:181-3426(+)
MSNNQGQDQEERRHHNQQQQQPSSSMRHYAYVDHQSTPNGDIVYDDTKNIKSHCSNSNNPPSCSLFTTSSDDDDSFGNFKPLNTTEDFRPIHKMTTTSSTTAPTTAKSHHESHGMNSEQHSRNTHHRSLSGLFSEATSLSDNNHHHAYKNNSNIEHEKRDGPTATTYPTQELNPNSRTDQQQKQDQESESNDDSSPSSSRKHRRMYSGGVSNPSMAHRRINSKGKASFINRNSNLYHHHQAGASGNDKSMNHRGSGKSTRSRGNPNDHVYSSYRPRSTSPKPSPKYYHHTRNYSRDDSDADLLLSSSSSTNYYKKHYNTQEAASWLQHMRRSPPVEMGAQSVDFISQNHHHPHHQAPPPPSHMHHQNQQQQHYGPRSSPPNVISQLPPPSRHNTAYGAQRPQLQEPSSLHSNSSVHEYRYSPVMERISPPSSQFGHSSTHIQSQYPMQQLQSQHHRGNVDVQQTSGMNANKSCPQVPVQHLQQGSKQTPHDVYYRKSSAAATPTASSKRSTSSSSSSSQEPTPRYPPPRQSIMKSTSSSSRYHYRASTYDAATHAARKATGLPHHPLATGHASHPHLDPPQMNPSRQQQPMSQVPTPMPFRQASLGFSESRIETDEPLFQKEENTIVPTHATIGNTNTNPHNDNSNDIHPSRIDSPSPSYRISPQLFQESLRESLRGSPNSLTFSSSYQESLLSSLVDNYHQKPQPLQGSIENTPRSSPTQHLQQQQQHHQPISQQYQLQQQQQHVQMDDKDPHHRTSSSLSMFSSLLQSASLKRMSSNDSFNPLDTDLMDSSNLDLQPDYIRSTSATVASASAPHHPAPVHQLSSSLPKSNANNNPSTPLPPKSRKDSNNVNPPTADTTSSGRKVSGSVSKRVRKKCSVGDCSNRVVQGGLCITHGAKRKLCGHPGCNKHVKKAGKCSTHGPARKRCDVENCEKVAVQGGRCIAHGAKKKLCSVDNCSKQAILSGMCKKHHDQEQFIEGHDSSTSSNMISAYCIPVPVGSVSNAEGLARAKENEGNSPIDYASRGEINSSTTTSHRRGLSIFQDMQTVDTIIGSSSTPANDSTISSSVAGSSSNSKSSWM